MLKHLLRTLSIAAAAFPATAGTRLAIETSIDIPASPDVIWDILADTDAYPEWNPYHVLIDGEMKVGEALAVHVEKPNGTELTVHPHLMESERGRSLVWGGGPTGIFRGVHRFDLEALSAGCTRLHHTEVFSGLLVPFADLDAIEPGYVLMNEALRDRVATLHGDSSAC